MKFLRTRHALIEFDRVQPLINRGWATAESTEAIRQLELDEVESKRRVQTAFYGDTQHLNSLESCRSLDIAFMRRMVSEDDNERLARESLVSVLGEMYGLIDGVPKATLTPWVLNRGNQTDPHMVEAACILGWTALCPHLAYLGFSTDSTGVWHTHPVTGIHRMAMVGAEHMFGFKAARNLFTGNMDTPSDREVQGLAMKEGRKPTWKEYLLARITSEYHKAML